MLLIIEDRFRGIQESHPTFQVFRVLFGSKLLHLRVLSVSRSRVPGRDRIAISLSLVFCVYRVEFVGSCIGW